MSQVTRRGLLGGAALGSIGLAACKTAPKAAAGFEGELAFLHGVASGDPLPSSMILWTRVTPLSGSGPVTVAWEILEVGSDTAAANGEVVTSEAADYTVKADATGLKAGTAYTYRFKAKAAGGEVVSPEGRTRTPSADSAAAVKLCVTSCANWQFGLFNAYREMASEPGLDAIVHLGDYMYEYGVDGYGGDVAQKIGRPHDPPTEIVSLSDYRRRHAQYKSDPNLQAAHAAAPWICTWDDHESANDSYRTGAENHNPDKGEGEWSDRKMRALQAYFEWMPIREPKAGEVTSAVWRTFRFGTVATVHALDSRLTGRSQPLDWGAALAGATSQEDMGARVMATMQAVADPARTMLGAEQEAWLANEFKASVQSGAAWQVLANQVVMARVKLPDFTKIMTPEQVAAQDVPQVVETLPFTALGLPWNLDAWDGYPAARERLYGAAASAGAALLTLAGDTHTAYANELYDAGGVRRGIEFACTSVSSPGMGSYVKAMPDLGEQITAVNPEIVWHDPFSNGYTLVTLTRETARADYRTVSTIYAPAYTASTAASYVARIDQSGVSGLDPA
ncbi:MAG: alkaline phosphatase [Hyphomonas sp.]|uniref:alkaline phosphatase D family protein n=1 Tax=Hyphomonas sp. TaxID=87 RepID=UPI0018101A8A|nr:alkaline phosphatase D family protein [Hyphomonas sp.]MBU3920079.1 alkaline phosphatase D family protein [Alphaproteobacteria bacterium]MBA3068604.1 alkaline phosphatase [Hyphomonas sp.]MBU4061923.1 alkaline phosphatase D family protein [Alphaproteobacteria bacterium]MBU4166078.1 alkaline phosphatase D family protein [Alphaproteobacteria bacterium]MBU4567731.1 alkaline phosphatase D family protein [Alphaproteobacteria bacterium]